VLMGHPMTAALYVGPIGGPGLSGEKRLAVMMSPNEAKGDKPS